MKADKNKAKVRDQIDKTVRERQWIKWAFNQRDEVHERNREKYRYDIVNGKLYRARRQEKYEAR
jgi:hypothetical protein